MFAQAMAGTCVSLTVTVKVQALVFPLVSNAVQVTRVTPLGKVEPLAGWQRLVTPGQLSVEVKVQVTLLLLHKLPSVTPAMFPGQVTEGASVSLTVTLKLQPLVLPLGAVAVQVTLVVPLGKAKPLAGEQTIAAGQVVAGA